MIPIEYEALKYLRGRDDYRRTSEIRDAVLKNLPQSMSQTTDYLRRRLRRLESLGLVKQIKSRGRNSAGYAWRITERGANAIG